MNHHSRIEKNPLVARFVARKRPYALGDNDLLRRQREVESNARSYPRRIPLALRGAKGIYVEDVEGRVFIDCLACAGALALGHGHPAVLEALRGALAQNLPWQTLDLTTPVKDRFVRELFSLLPDSLSRQARIQFCGPTGADAVEAALKLVKTATGRSGVVAFSGGYHGMTQACLGIMGNLEPKRSIGGGMPGVQFAPYAYDFRCPFGLRGEAGEGAGLAYLANLLHDPESGVLPPAGIILEAIQGEGGVVPASASWLRGVRELARGADVPFIVDEVQTGFGRTGDLFAFQHADITPDVVVLSKAIGGGLPLSAVVYHEDLDQWQPGSHAGTFRGNQLAMAAGTAAMKVLRTECLAQHAAVMGRRLSSYLHELQEDYACIGDVRGRGLMLGMEIVDPSEARDKQGRPRADGAMASALQQACLERGLIVELGGRNGATVRFLPPLIVTEVEIDWIAEIVADAFKGVLQG